MKNIFFEESLDFIESACHHSLLSQTLTFSLIMSIAKINPYNDYFNDKINHILLTIFVSSQQISMANHYFNLISSTYTGVKPQEITSLTSPLITTKQKDTWLYECFKKAAHKALANKDNNSAFAPEGTGLDFTKISPKAVKHAFAFLNAISVEFDGYDDSFLEFLKQIDAKDFDILTKKRSILSRLKLPDHSLNAQAKSELPIQKLKSTATEPAEATAQTECEVEPVELPSQLATPQLSVTVAEKEQDFTTALLSLKNDANQQTTLIISLLNTTLHNLQDYLLDREKRRVESVSNRVSFFLSDVFSNQTVNRTQFVQRCQNEINQHLEKLHREPNTHNYDQIITELKSTLLIIKERFPGIEMIKIYEATKRRINELKMPHKNITPNSAA